MRRCAGLVVLAGLLCLSGPRIHLDGSARTNEGTAVVLINPSNGLPPGWTWQH